MNVHQWVKDAYPTISPYIRKTPLEFSPYLSSITGAKVYLKMENLQITGSFKARGGLNKILNLSDKDIKLGVVAASTGNHAAAVANAVDLAGTFARIYMPTTVSETKIENLKQFKNAEIVLSGHDSVEAELAAIEYANANNLNYVSPYNDPQIIGGQGTIALEVLEELPELESIFVPIGGGGLIAGIAGYLKETKPGIEVIGCQPENSAVMYYSIKAGKVLNMESQPTISDGTAGGMEEDSITFPLCQKYVDDYQLITEDEIRSALRLLIEKHYLLVEGAAGLSVAALIKNKAAYKDKTVALILCGNKMTPSLLASVLQAK